MHLVSALDSDVFQCLSENKNSRQEVFTMQNIIMIFALCITPLIVVQNPFFMFTIGKILWWWACGLAAFAVMPGRWVTVPMYLVATRLSFSLPYGIDADLRDGCGPLFWLGLAGVLNLSTVVPQRTSFLVCLSISAVMVSIGGITQSLGFNWFPWPVELHNVTSTLYNANTCGLYGAVVGIYLIEQALKSKSWLVFVAGWGTLLLPPFAKSITGSIFALLGIIFLIFKFSNWRLSVLAFAVVVAAAYPTVLDPGKNTLFAVLDRVLPTGTGFNARLDVYCNAVMSIFTHPLGQGPGQFFYSGRQGVWFSKPHSGHLDAFLSLGWAGGVLWLAWFWRRKRNYYVIILFLALLFLDLP